MKGDFSKGTFDAGKHFHDVLMQQGRVLLDQEWNEQADINAHRTETGTKDIIGNTGAPLHNAGFAITSVMDGGSPPAANDLQIGKGNYYVDGILCENESDLLFTEQPDFEATPLPAEPGTYIFYLDVWLRHITALEDTRIREVALGGPDTTTRTKTIWQVKYIATAADALCAAGLPQAITAPPTGTMNARSEVSTASDDPCGLTSSGGYRRLQNQLYRVEIHIAGADRAHATFKWSRDNGSVLVKCTGQEAANKNNLLVTSTGRDDLLGFKSGNWVEVIHDDNDLLNTPGILAQILTVNGNVITIDPNTIKDSQNAGATFITIDTTKNPRIRRWDSEGDIDLNTNNNTWIALEDGVEINFREGTFKTGDYWLVPARTAIADVEWPFTTPQLAKGIQHHFAQLAIVTLNAGAWTVTDCRSLFPPLTELTSLYYVGGDGQQAMPGNPLPDTLKVGVANGEWIVSGAPIKFEIRSGGGALVPASGLVTTGADGIASCAWTLGADTSNLTLQVKASLLDDAGAALPNHLPILFNAGFSIAQNVAYQPQCDNWAGQPPATVAEALDQLCERRSEGGDKCCSIAIGPGGEFKTLAEAIFKLAGQQIQDVSLCLLPGDHAIDEDIDMLQREIRFRTLHITGAAAYITMKANMLRLIAEKIILEGFSLVTNEARNTPEDPKIVLRGGQVNIDHCFFFRLGASPAPFVYIDKLAKDATAYITNSSFLAFFSLVLADGIQGVLENNVITFLVLQNGNFNDFKPAGLFWLNIDIKNQLKEALRDVNNRLYNFTNWVLTIRGNRVGAIITDNNRLPPQNMYQSLVVAENIFQLQEGVFISNSFLAQHITMVNNQFLYPVPHDNNITLAFVLSYRGVVMGNMAEDRKLIVDALMVQDLIGVEPFLNMLEVKV